MVCDILLLGFFMFAWQPLWVLSCETLDDLVKEVSEFTEISTGRSKHGRTA